MTMTVQRFIDRRIPSQLREAFGEMMRTITGSQLAEALAQRRARYILDPTGKLGRSAMTINLLRLAIIGKGSLDDRPWLISCLAHEAAHIKQGYISDSFEQEYVAFTTAAQVMKELDLKDHFGWDTPKRQGLSPEQAAQKIMELYPDHPLYGMNPAIPVYQVQGAREIIELAKQAWALLKAA
jgi:hypothetical protein